MKKTLLAAAVVAGFAGAAHAETSNVTVYGIMDAAVEFANGGGQVGSAGSGSALRVQSGGQSGSRVGFKGAEDLGGGLKAIFQLEAGMSIDTGASTQGGLAWGRQSYVGLAGNFGTFALGRQYTPHFAFYNSIDPFGTGIGSAASTSMTVASLGGVAAGVNTTVSRANNAIAYISPTAGGVTGILAFVPSENANDPQKSAGQAWSGSVTYANGPINVGFAYLNLVLADGTTGTTNLKMPLIGGTYDLKVVKLAAGFGRPEADLTAYGNVKHDEYFVGLTAPVGAGTIAAEYASGNLKGNNISNAKATQISLGYSYALSQRTNVYTVYTHVANDDNVAFTIGGATWSGLAVAAGKDPSSFSVGIRHAF